jgi:hypothetical protein
MMISLTNKGQARTGDTDSPQFAAKVATVQIHRRHSVMTSTGQKTKRSEDPGGQWSLTVGQRENSLSSIETALFERGMSPRDEFLRLIDGADSEILAAKIANIFAAQNKTANVPSERAHKLFESRSGIISLSKVLTIKDWIDLFPALKYNAGHVKEIAKLRAFPWRPCDLTGSIPNDSDYEWQSSLAFLALPSNTTDDLLRIIEKDPVVSEGVRIHLKPQHLYWAYGLEASYPDWGWVLMPRKQAIPLTGQESQCKRRDLVPEGYSVAGFRDTLNFVIGCLTAGVPVSASAGIDQPSSQTVGFVCESKYPENPNVLLVTVDPLTDAHFGITHISLSGLGLEAVQKNVNLILPIKKNLPGYYVRLKEKQGL